MPDTNFHAPWEIDGDFDAAVDVTVVDRHGFPVGYFEPSAGEDLDEWDADSIARVRLIAAAPELLGCLKEALQQHYNAFEPDNQAAYYLRWKAAIAKAEGLDA